ncbi:MAG: AtpZ/AtpI family protein [Bacteroidota bacterium]
MDNKPLPPSERQRPDGKQKIMNQVGPYLGLGSQLAAAVGVTGLAGWWLDKHFETKPVLFIVFLILGVFVGMYQFISTVAKLSNKK